MNRKIRLLFLAMFLLYLLSLPVSAEEPESLSQGSIPEAETFVQEIQVVQETQEAQETQENTTATMVMETQATLFPEATIEQAVVPVSLQEALTLDTQCQYPGMDRTYQAGYNGTVAYGRLVKL